MLLHLVKIMAQSSSAPVLMAVLVPYCCIWSRSWFSPVQFLSWLRPFQVLSSFFSPVQVLSSLFSPVQVLSSWFRPFQVLSSLFSSVQVLSCFFQSDSGSFLVVQSSLAPVLVVQTISGPVLIVQFRSGPVLFSVRFRFSPRCSFQFSSYAHRPSLQFSSCTHRPSLKYEFKCYPLISFCPLKRTFMSKFCWNYLSLSSETQGQPHFDFDVSS